jgi:CRISPR-associated endonuclease/helicase Cas3
MTFEQYFTTATRDSARAEVRSPYHYQRRLACGEKRVDEEDDAWLERGTDCASRLIEIPTGLGKTAAVVLAWLWNRVHLGQKDWPRRLVYCLPMRTLVEQTAGEVEKWITNLSAKADELVLSPSAKESLAWLSSPVVLMGGEDSGDWDIHPEREAILIGTQDMLLSRALNRGYGMSRYRWPMHFGLLNNECLWVLDETQLMGPGLATACQLEAFRSSPASEESVTRFDSIPSGKSVTWYASATGNREHLKTREWRGIERPKSFYFGLLDVEKASHSGPIAERLRATKMLSLEDRRNFVSKQKAPDASLVSDIWAHHQSMLTALADAPAEIPRRTLVICNTVDRAIAVHGAIKKLAEAERGLDLMLMHSRFRPTERASQAERLKAEHLAKHPSGQLIVATQVIEAGVDLSSGNLWSEVAPLASLVQRLGRLNRSGEFGFDGSARYGFTPQAFVIGIAAAEIAGTKDEKLKKEREADRDYLPYARQKCAEAWSSLKKLNGSASPHSLYLIAQDIADSIERCPYSLQRHELLDFFDTDANLSLGFTDVSPFVRGIDPDSDIHVLWRDWESDDDGKPKFWPDYQCQELCPVPIGKTKDGEARRVLGNGWLWRGKDSGWMSVRTLGDVAPGMTILLPTSAGGYDPASGWTGDAKDPVASCYVESDGPSDDDLLSYLANGWRSIAEHTAEVAHEASEIVKALQSILPSEEVQKAIQAGIQWHDIGKGHERWQSAAAEALSKAQLAGRETAYLPIAKFSLSESPLLLALTGPSLKQKIRELRSTFKPGVAHEVASALAFRLREQKVHGLDRPIESLLAEYLIMSHHGHVRKVLRDEIPWSAPSAKDTETVRGVSNGDALPAMTIDGYTLGCEALSIECRRMGRDEAGHESYTRCVLRLLDRYGPFRLAYFEALFRAADMRASKVAAKPQQAQP